MVIKKEILMPLTYSLQHAIALLKDGNVVEAQSVLNDVRLSVAELVSKDQPGKKFQEQ